MLTKSGFLRLLILSFPIVLCLNLSLVQAQSGEITDVVWSPDGSMYAFSGETKGCSTTNQFPVHIFSASTGQIVKTLPGMTCSSTSLDWSPDGTQMVSVNVVQSVAYIWDIPTETLLRTVPLNIQGSISIRWSPSGDLIATSGFGDYILVWDPTTGQLVGPGLYGANFDWSPDSSKIAGGTTQDNRIFIQDVTTGNILVEITAEPTRSMDWSPDGSRIASSNADDKVHVWNATNGQSQLTLTVPNISNAKWSPDGQKLATVTIDGIIQVWDANTGVQLNSSTTALRLYTIAWSPDGTELAYGDPDSSVQTVPAPGSPTPTPTSTPSGNLTLQVSSGSDDMNELDATLLPSQTTVWFGNGGSTTTSYLGLRFNNVAIPHGATITAARLEFYSVQSQWQNVGAEIRAQAVDNAPTFTTSSIPSQRATGTQMVTHATNVQWSANTWYTFQDSLHPVLQEVIDRAGWQSGNSLVLIIKGTSPGQWGRKYVASYEGNPTLAARLVITFTGA